MKFHTVFVKIPSDKVQIKVHSSRRVASVCFYKHWLTKSLHLLNTHRNNQQNFPIVLRRKKSENFQQQVEWRCKKREENISMSYWTCIAWRSSCRMHARRSLIVKPITFIQKTYESIIITCWERGRALHKYNQKKSFVSVTSRPIIRLIIIIHQSFARQPFDLTANLLCKRRSIFFFFLPFFHTPKSVEKLASQLDKSRALKRTYLGLPFRIVTVVGRGWRLKELRFIRVRIWNQLMKLHLRSKSNDRRIYSRIPLSFASPVLRVIAQSWLLSKKEQHELQGCWN